MDEMKLSGSVRAVNITTGKSGSAALIRRVHSMPFIPGMEISINTAHGGDWVMPLIASLPSRKLSSFQREPGGSNVWRRAA